MDRKKIVVAFGDIRGFRRWMLRAINAPEIAWETMNQIYLLFEDYSCRSQNYIKFLGDGFVVIKELNRKNNALVVRSILEDMAILSRSIIETLKMTYPRPDGFRVRVATGHVWKRITKKKINGRIVNHPEYIGYAINMAQSLLYVYPEINCICHEGIIEIIGKRKNGISVEHLEPPKERRSGIDQQDFTGLWSFEVNEKKVPLN